MKDRTGKKRGAKSKVIWGDIDWDRQDVEIARENGCSRERVRQKRKELGVGRSSKWHNRKGTIKEKLEKMNTEGKTLVEISEELGCSRSYVIQMVKELGIGYKKIDGSKYDWSKANWGKTDLEVAIDLGVNNTGVVSQYRFRHGIIKRSKVPVHIMV